MYRRRAKWRPSSAPWAPNPRPSQCWAAYTKYPGGPELEDHTLALKLFAGKHGTRAYPGMEQLMDFGRRICGVSQPGQVLEAIASGMRKTLQDARGDDRISSDLLLKLETAWDEGLMDGR